MSFSSAFKVSKMVPVEYQIFATAHLRYSINRKADALVNGYEQVEQDKRNDHGIYYRCRHNHRRAGVQDIG